MRMRVKTQPALQAVVKWKLRKICSLERKKALVEWLNLSEQRWVNLSERQRGLTELSGAPQEGQPGQFASESFDLRSAINAQDPAEVRR